MFTTEDVKEKNKACSNCSVTSMEWCIKQHCPYCVVKHYTDKDRERFEHIKINREKSCYN